MLDGPDAETNTVTGHGDARPGETVQAFLRRATRPWHDAVEQAFAPFDLATTGGLGAFLLRQSNAVLPLESALEAADIGGVVQDWSTRRRGDALRADLRGLGIAVPERGPSPTITSRHHALGVLYVLEGSRLGGRILARRVLSSPDTRVREACRFLGHHLPGGWARFVAILDACATDAAEFTALGAGAETAFALFHATATAAGNDSEKADAMHPKAPLVHFAHA